MKILNFTGLALAATMLFSCGGNNSSTESNENSEGGATLSGEVKIDGSSTVYPITAGMAEFFAEVQPDVEVTVGVSGTGGGFKKFSKGETDINDASRPIKEKEIQICNENGITYHKVTVAYDGLAVVVNKENNFIDYLTVAELKTLWGNTGKVVTKWNEVRASFPAEKIILYGPGEASGTFDYFNEAILGSDISCRTEYSPSENDNVLVKGVSADKFALGYFGLAYYEENKENLKIVPIDGGNGPVIPTMETVKNDSYTPLSRPIFIYVSNKSVQKPQVKAFIDFYLKKAGDVAKEVGYIPLPAEKYKQETTDFEAFATKK